MLTEQLTSYELCRLPGDVLVFLSKLAIVSAIQGILIVLIRDSLQLVYHVNHTHIDFI